MSNSDSCTERIIIIYTKIIQCFCQTNMSHMQCEESLDKVHIKSANENDIEKELLQEVVFAQAEQCILEKASRAIKEFSYPVLTQALCENKGKSYLSNDGKSETVSEAQRKDLELDKQVRVGELTPFEAAAKKSTSVFNKATQLLDLEKYLQQQAELAKQKCLSKKLIVGKKLEGSSIETRVPKKRMKLSTSVAERTDENQRSLECENDSDPKCNSGSEYIPSDDCQDSEAETEQPKKGSAKRHSKKCIQNRVLDDGDEDAYHQRVENKKFCFQAEKLHEIDNLFKVPKSIWKRLYRYQKVSIQWLWELHGRNSGGLLGDEMGLGKTVQVIAFLAGLDCSNLLSDGGRFRGLGPTLIICPATLLEQWVKHFHDWWPILRIATLHQSGTYSGDPYDLVESMKTGGVLVTSYSGVLNHKELLVRTQWHYVILDEGHKIRNPHAKISKAVKEFTTPHRLLLTGSPMQNSLKELWSLFDFILPGKLGTLPAFLEHFAGPITRGGYVNASSLQEATALQVATLLKDAITPYMLRRTKSDVQHHVRLPEKNEQVLFCSLTEEQKTLYKKYLTSEDVTNIIHEKSSLKEGGRYRARLLIALTTMRKICNHPDLYIYGKQTDSDEELELTDEIMERFGYWKRAGKMAVVRSLLKIWKNQAHRVLLFTQSKQMMHILESLIQREDYTYLRMDGTTPMSQRQQTIEKFNGDPSYFLFLLTTRVGGLGVNLTGANRVIIYDPDWNPATDAQARERAWRIGQSKNVTVYRLITAGTIEEKMYHRQIFKLLLSNRVLEDPRQRRLFHTTDLVELFNLNEPSEGEGTESDRLFGDSRLAPTTGFTSSKIEAMRKLASCLSKRIGDKVTKKKPVEEEKRIDHPEDARVPCARGPGNSGNATAPGLSSPLREDADKSYGEPKSSVSTDAREEEVDVEHKRHRKTKHRKRKKIEETDRISSVFEGERISYLIGRRLPSHVKDAPTVTDDSYVLQKLFAKAAVKSAFQHEAVLSSVQQESIAQTPMQRLALEAAQESMNSVRQSRKWCWKPSWNKAPGEND
ncbi:DNA excision repair protein ERCC-6 [Orussus abietinus]|uniref:DNA excision repair protein ERCC-6 n=1 Tax=Orussus abietinus TaxID=222816 RepID=UPI000625F979|nr:DNA excision repair protein ERCC-6 [Orussus abietinus]